MPTVAGIGALTTDPDKLDQGQAGEDATANEKLASADIRKDDSRIGHVSASTKNDLSDEMRANGIHHHYDYFAAARELF